MKLLAVTIFLCSVACFESLKYDSKNGILPPKESCGLQSSVGGSMRQGAGPDDYPWMVFIPTHPRMPSPPTNYRCAGVLISKRYFIMSKHCLQSYIDYVHIGQHDTSQNVTCGSSGCRPVHKVKAVSWPSHDELSVAVVRLEKDVEFSENVQPICLPFEDFPRAQLGERVYSSGWGQTVPGGAYSLIKKNIKQSIITNEECEANGVIGEAANDSFMCTKLHLNEITDIPGEGDAGAPIMYQTPNNQWVLQGILPWLYNWNIEKSIVAGAKINAEALEFILKYMRE